MTSWGFSSKYASPRKLPRWSGVSGECGSLANTRSFSARNRFSSGSLIHLTIRHHRVDQPLDEGSRQWLAADEPAIVNRAEEQADGELHVKVRPQFSKCDSPRQQPYDGGDPVRQDLFFEPFCQLAIDRQLRNQPSQDAPVQP